MRVLAPLVCGLLVALSSPALLQAQAETDTAMDGTWHFRLMPYFWAAGIDGTASVTGVTEVPLEASFSDIIWNFDIGLLGHFEARKDPMPRPAASVIGGSANVRLRPVGSPFTRTTVRPVT